MSEYSLRTPIIPLKSPCGYLKIIVILQPFKYYYLCDGNITQMCLLIKSRIEMRKNLNWDNKTLKKFMEFLKNKGYIGLYKIANESLHMIGGIVL